MLQCALHNSGERVLDRAYSNVPPLLTQKEEARKLLFNHLIAEWGCHHFRCVSSIRSQSHSVTSDRELKAQEDETPRVECACHQRALLTSTPVAAQSLKRQTLCPPSPGARTEALGEHATQLAAPKRVRDV